METTGRGNTSNHRKVIRLTSEQTHKRQSHINRQRARAKLKLLYTNEPDCQTVNPAVSAINVTVSLRYIDVELKLACPFGLSLEHLPYMLHKQMLYYEMQKANQEALQAVAKVIGFESVRRNITFDYKLSIGRGELTRSLDLKCFHFSKDKDLKKYKIYRCLAIGGFSKVYLVRSRRDGRFFAMKVMQKEFIFNNEKEGVVINQKKICSNIEHPFIVKLYHAFETKNFTFFIFQYCPGGELFYLLKKVKRMSETQARFYFIEIMYGLQYLHEKGIIYRDLKPENLLITADGHLKIADFGLSKQGMDPQTLTYSYCGSAEYMPPEMILRTGHSFGVDYYTLGALLYELVTGLPPFYSRNEEEIRDYILYQPLAFPRDLPLSDQIKSLLSGLLNKNQKMRLGCLKGIKEILFHPWLGKLDSKAILNKLKNPPFSPDLEQLNFDDNQLGDDQKQFTQKVRKQAKLKQPNKNINFCGIFYQSEQNTLSQQHQKILQSLNNKETSYSGTEGCMDKIIKNSPYLSRLFKHREMMGGSVPRKAGGNVSSCDRENYHTHSITDLRRIYGGGGEFSNSRRVRGPLKEMKENSTTNLRHKLIPIGKSQSPLKKLKLKLNQMIDD